MTPAGEKLMLEALQAIRDKQDDFCSRLDEVRDGVKSVRAAVVDLDQRSALHEQLDEHRHEATTGRLAALEKNTTETGQRHMVQLESTIATWRGRVWSILATLLTSAIVGLVTYYVAHR